MKNLLLSTAILITMFACSKEEVKPAYIVEKEELGFTLSAKDGTRFNAILKYGVNDALDQYDTLNTLVLVSGILLNKGEYMSINVTSNKPMKLVHKTNGVKITDFLVEGQTLKIYQ